MHSVLHQISTDAIFDIVALAVSFVLGTCLGVRVKKWWLAHEHTQKLIADRLDTSTPGGLADVVRAVDDTDAP